MPKRVISTQRGQPLLDIVSYARRGPGRRDRLSREQREHISRTVRRIPEVMIKVLTHGGQDLRAIQRHLDYIARRGELELETDDGQQLKGEDVAKKLLDDWDLDLESYRRSADLAAALGHRPPKLIHKLLFSMPAGTPPDKVLAAVRHFAREQFDGKHRYAMALHTDEPHPHVHMALKAVSEQGVRLHIRKETLREWRREFARHLRKLGVAANATDRAVRGLSKTQKIDGIFRAARRGDSSHMQTRVEATARALSVGQVAPEAGKARLTATRRQVAEGWRCVGQRLNREGQHHLAAEVERFLNELPPPLTEREWIASQLQHHARNSGQRTQVPTR